MTEKELIRQLKQSSHKAFTSLYEIYAPQLYAYIFSLTESKSITNDIVQETFIKIWAKRKEIKENLSFKSFIFTISKNKLMNEFRRQLKNPVFSDYTLLNISKEMTEENQAEKKIDFDEFNRQLQHAKTKISPRQAQIFELNKEEGRSIREISKQLNIKEQVVRNQLSIALRTLRHEMKEYMFMLLCFIT